MASLSMFGFVALWSPYFLAFLLLVTWLYFMVVGPWRTRFTNEGPPTRKQKVYFVLGIVLLYVCQGSPIDLLGHLIFSAHMVQMAILNLLVPQLLILGIPNWLFERLLQIRPVKATVTFLTKPLVALVLFNGLFSLYHVPFVFDLVKSNALYHAVMTSMLFIAAWMMWWPLINKMTGWQSLTGLKKIGYIFADGVLLTPACALIIFAGKPLYATYYDPQMWMESLALCVPAGTLASLDLTGPEMFFSIPLLHDQQLGGILMKIIQEIVYGTMLFFVFMEWYRKEQEKEKEETVVSPQPSEL
ncbi:cytochrome c oxidase assembly factor CtaG [Parageobacillus thermoglucosidasius]|uniref:Cytochrome c oxidase assembly factor CtaG n=1 Tax=Parageobacillus thermoglucosidasius TaxID=1426 RepID=A0AB38R131_PARTM|nr:cytochrome c oxidase assembly factor CtaG [Parageobacillus thermoglucosidasius]MBY6267752.1 cytochrome c oxidase assembly factor CtaG [Parageobacillus thermoglucosidasius]OUM85853.1 MAG: cytochrome c oxidase assembly factor CtaG [Parageobacillus thermoglucosidasius]UOE77309.1 cytochrome c oxidase assembly factor CtaG [Parageobacillus thermoglucosidasius]GCD83475.1 cytochrome c oxidase assembly factor CtaG [Parageobacillus thermoglucosidasius]